MDAAGAAVGRILHSPGIEADIPFDSAADKRVFRRGQFRKNGRGDDGFRFHLRCHRSVFRARQRLPAQKVDDSLWSSHFLLGHIPLGICGEHRAYDFHLRRAERAGAGVLLSAGVVASGAAL